MLDRASCTQLPLSIFINEKDWATFEIHLSFLPNFLTRWALCEILQPTMDDQQHHSPIVSIKHGMPLSGSNNPVPLRILPHSLISETTTLRTLSPASRCCDSFIEFHLQVTSLYQTPGGLIRSIPCVVLEKGPQTATRDAVWNSGPFTKWWNLMLLSVPRLLEDSPDRIVSF